MKSGGEDLKLALLSAGHIIDLSRVNRRLFFELIDIHRVAPWLYHQRSNLNLPVWLEEALAERVLSLRAVFMLDEHHRREVLKTLVAAGIDVTVLKGGVLGPWLYPKPELRPANDLDVLVRGDQVEVATEALQSIGYERELRGRGSWSERLSHEHAFWRGSDLPVELHTHITQRLRFRVLQDQLWERSFSWEWEGLRLRRFSVEDQILSLILHAAHHQFLIPIISWIDIRLLLDLKPDLTLISKRAKEWEMTGALYIAAALLNTLFRDQRLMGLAPSPGRFRKAALYPLLVPKAARNASRGALLDRWGAFWLIDKVAARMQFSSQYLLTLYRDRRERSKVQTNRADSPQEIRDRSNSYVPMEAGDR